MMKETPETPFVMDEKYAESYRQLEEMWRILEDLGYAPRRYPPTNIQDQWGMQNTFPIAAEGADGVRVTRRRDGNLIVSFTNGFEDPNDPGRIKITEQLRRAGFDVV